MRKMPINVDEPRDGAGKTESTFDEDNDPLAAMDRYFGSGPVVEEDPAEARDHGEDSEKVSRRASSAGPPASESGPGRKGAVSAKQQTSSPQSAGRAGRPDVKSGTDSIPENGNGVFSGQPTGQGSAVEEDVLAETRPKAGEGPEVVGPDDPGFLEEFGSVDGHRDPRQEIFDWFALDSGDPLDVGDDVFSEAQALPEILADAQKKRLGRADDGPNDGKCPVAGLADRQEPQAMSGMSGHGQPAGNDRDSGRFRSPKDELPDEDDHNNAPMQSRSSGGSGSVLGNMNWSMGLSQRRLAVLALAVIGGVAVMQVTGDGRILQILGRAGSSLGNPLGSVSPLSAMSEDAFPGNAGTHNGQLLAAQQGGGASSTGPVSETASGDAAEHPELLAHRAQEAPVTRSFRLELEPAGENPGRPQLVGASELAEWDRVFEFLDGPDLSALQVVISDTAGPEGAAVPASHGVMAQSDHPYRLGDSFTADDGFAMAIPGGFAELEQDVPAAGILGPDRPVPGEYGTGGYNVGTAARAVAPLPEHLPNIGRQAGAVQVPASDLEARLGRLENRLAAVDGQILRLQKRAATDVLRDRGPALLQFSPGNALARFDGPVEQGEIDSSGAYVISAGSGDRSITLAFDGVGIGDHVEGFGRVLEISDYGEEGRLFVMEEGAVLLN